jgi:hypothetical protein
MGPGTGRSGGPRATPADTLRALAGDISNFLNSVPTGQDLLVRDIPRAVENNASALAELFLGMLPGSGDAIAVRDAADFSGKTVDALRGGRFGDAAGNFGLAAASAAGALPFVPHLAGIFAGKGAKTADLVALRQAEDMAAGGANNEAIRAATGWFKGPDEKWRFEIPDNAAKLTGVDAGPASSVVQHDELFRAYPELARNPVERAPPRYGGEGSFDPATGEIAIHPRLDDDRARATLLHELQHAVQNDEGFARGGSLIGSVVNNDARKVFAKLYKERLDAILDPGTLEGFARGAGFDNVAEAKPFYDQHVKNLAEMRRKGVPSHLDRMAQETAQRQTYERMAGEVEARDVQSRADFAPDQRAATAPYSSQGIAPEDMIVLNRGGGVQASAELPMDEASRAARATEMGLDPNTPLYRGQTGDYESLRPAESGRFGRGVYASQQPGVAGMYGDTVLPLVGPKAEDLFNASPGWSTLTAEARDRILGQLTPEEAAKVSGLENWYKKDAEAFYEALSRSLGKDRASGAIESAGYKGITGIGDGAETVIFDPANVRSRFAKFDPAKAGTPELLGALGPLLAVMGIGAGAMGVDAPAEQ